jgi:hypothetical protein
MYHKSLPLRAIFFLMTLSNQVESDYVGKWSHQKKKKRVQINTKIKK